MKQLIILILRNFTSGSKSQWKEWSGSLSLSMPLKISREVQSALPSIAMCLMAAHPRAALSVEFWRKSARLFWPWSGSGWLRASSMTLIRSFSWRISTLARWKTIESFGLSVTVLTTLWSHLVSSHMSWQRKFCKQVKLWILSEGAATSKTGYWMRLSITCHQQHLTWTL